MATRNYISTDFATKLERARRKTQRLPQPHRSIPPLAPAPIVSSLFRVYNNGDETIPEFGVMQVEELSEQYGEFSGQTEDAYAVTKPTSDGTLYMVNAGGDILAGHFGAGMLANEPTKILIDPSASAEFADTYGPTNSEWYVSTTPVGTLFYLGENDGETGIFEQAARPLTSLVIGVSVVSSTATTATITSRPPGWSEVPGEAAGLVTVTNPSSIALSTNGGNLHAAYCERNSSNQWELLGSIGATSDTIAYGNMYAASLTESSTDITKIPLDSSLITAYGLTQSVVTSDFTIITEGDYLISHNSVLSLDSVGDTTHEVVISVCKNSSLAGNNLRTQTTMSISSGYIRTQPASATGILHLKSSDVIDIRYQQASGGSFQFRYTSMAVNLIRATTST